MIAIDGNTGEGGGQILRTALFCSLLTGKSFRLFRIRHSRYKPGITHQQLKLLELIEKLSDSTVTGASQGSAEISFYPGRVLHGNYQLTCEKPASLTLILQSVLPISWMANGEVDLILQGGTDFASSMTFDYMKGVLAPLLSGIHFNLARRDFYPGINGSICCRIPKDKTESPFNLTRVPLVKSISVHLVASNVFSNVFEPLADGVTMFEKLSYPVEYFREECNTSEPGAAITLIAHCDENERLGAQGVMKIGDDPLRVGHTACDALLEEIRSNCCVDRYAADNLIPWLLLWGGAIRPSAITRHLTTCVFICQQFLPDKLQLSNGVITVEKISRDRSVPT